MNNIFERCIPIIIEHEGGFVNNLHDRGGATQYGISLLFLKSLTDADHDGWLDGDINHDKIVDIKDIQGLTPQAARQLYQRNFWNKWYNLLNDELLALHLFDHAVNAGPYRAHKMLQNIIHVSPDGAIGQVTVKTANDSGRDLVAEYISARKSFYRSIVDADATQHQFLAGWLNRVDSTHF